MNKTNPEVKHAGLIRYGYSLVLAGVKISVSLSPSLKLFLSTMELRIRVREHMQFAFPYCALIMSLMNTYKRRSKWVKNWLCKKVKI